ncbi:MAG: folylpolyglutamate synthase/dihydrofolate synthase family protein [Rhodospirillaceae bacterium]|nr:folylpolyglutamate synthase/dihydrofolate synthase family protein [Rhodospirillaceae bacterium]
MTDTAADSPDVQRALERFTSLYPKLIDLSLERMHRLLGDLGNPHHRLPPVIHVAGTNGKGSTIAAMRSVLEAGGYKVHVYTSPHLVRFAERIRLVGSLIDEGLLAELLHHVENVNAGRPITFFEVTTAVAFMAFSQIPADVVLLETGMGGTFDATNVIDRPLTTVITSISMDHMQYLGDTIAKIAQEKANIMKFGVACVSVAQHADAAAVLAATAARIGASLKMQGQQWVIETEDSAGLRFRGERETWAVPSPSLLGRHQHQNIGAALAALEQSAFAIPTFALRSGMRAIDWPARAQRLKKGPLVQELPWSWEVYLDGGHNAGGGQAIAELIDDLWRDRPLHVVAGMLTTKAAEDFLVSLAPRAASFTAVPVPGHAAAYAPEVLAEAAAKVGFSNVGFGASPMEAVQRVKTLTPAQGRVLICGSLYLAGEVLKENA